VVYWQFGRDNFLGCPVYRLHYSLGRNDSLLWVGKETSGSLTEDSTFICSLQLIQGVIKVTL